MSPSIGRVVERLLTGQWCIGDVVFGGEAQETQRKVTSCTTKHNRVVPASSRDSSVIRECLRDGCGSLLNTGMRMWLCARNLNHLVYTSLSESFHSDIKQSGDDFSPLDTDPITGDVKGGLIVDEDTIYWNYLDLETGKTSRDRPKAKI